MRKKVILVRLEIFTYCVLINMNNMTISAKRKFNALTDNKYSDIIYVYVLTVTCTYIFTPTPPPGPQRVYLFIKQRILYIVEYTEYLWFALYVTYSVTMYVE